jgi:ATP-dependent Clp protease ATP-binding subunit ClpB
MNSPPEVINQLKRQILELDTESTLLSEKNDEASKQRLNEVGRESTRLENELFLSQIKFYQEQNRVDELRKLKRKLKYIKIQLDLAEEEKNFPMITHLKYVLIPKLEQRIAEIERNITEQNERQNRLINEVVQPSAIVEIGLKLYISFNEHMILLIFQLVE